MDGNRRWATEQDMSPIEGHKQGVETFKKAVQWLRDEQIPHGVFYAFSTENWQRSTEEVEALLHLFREVFTALRESSETNRLAIRIIGRREDFSPALQLDIAELESQTKQYEKTGTIWVALSYGGRAEIVDAVNRAIRKGECIDEAGFGQLLQTKDMPDPDIIMRTSGEQRLSNFLPWESIYSELYFVAAYWPALTEADFKDILGVYEQRKRRRGK